MTYTKDKEQRINMRLSKQEKELLIDKATLNGMTLSQFIRWRLLYVTD